MLREVNYFIVDTELWHYIRERGVAIFKGDKQKEISPGFFCSQSRPYTRLTEQMKI